MNQKFLQDDPPLRFKWFFIYVMKEKKKLKMKVFNFGFLLLQAFYFIKSLNFLKIYYDKFVWVTILIIANASFKSLIQVIVELVKTHSGTLSTYLW